MRSTSKYGNIFTERDGITFRSAAEARRYDDLKLLELAGEIAGLQLQPRYPLVVNGVKVGTYVGDFKYVDVGTGRSVVEDVKGAASPMYRMKRKLVKALYGVDIEEVEA